MDCIGIDLGSMNSCCSYYNTKLKRVDVIPNSLGNYSTPTMIYLSKDTSEILYGDVVSDLLKSNNNGEYLENIFTNIKRLLGLSYDDFMKNTDLNVGFKQNIVNKKGALTFKVLYNKQEKFFTVADLIKLYLKFLKNTCEEFLNNEIKNCCITIPVYFNDSQREILKMCCKDVNLNILRILNEPTAAALSYGFHNTNLESEYSLIIDSGAGTTDISLLYMDYTEAVYEVKNTAGDNFLGGEDITNNIDKYIQSKINREVSKKQLNKIKVCAENIKKDLSFKSSSRNILEFEEDHVINISRIQFNEINKEWFGKVKNLIWYVIDGYIQQNIHFTINKIANIIFIGGTTKIPYFKQLITDMFGHELTINNTIDPDQTVSIGAALQGALLSNLIDEDSGGDILLLDTIPLNIGIETSGGLMSPIISRNTLLPVSRSKSFTNSDAFDDTILINIYRGQRKFVKDNELIGTFTLHDEILGNYDKGDILITITFDIDSNSIITGKAIAKVSDYEIITEIKVVKTLVNVSTDLDEILLNADMNKLIDSELSSKILAKMELYDSFKNLLSIFHEKRDIIEEQIKEESSSDSFLISELNNVFNSTFNIIQDYQNYTNIELKTIKTDFENKWHALLFGGSFILKDENNLIIEYGGTSI